MEAKILRKCILTRAVGEGEVVRVMRIDKDENTAYIILDDSSSIHVVALDYLTLVKQPWFTDETVEERVQNKLRKSTFTSGSFYIYSNRIHQLYLMVVLKTKQKRTTDFIKYKINTHRHSQEQFEKIYFTLSPDALKITKRCQRVYKCSEYPRFYSLNEIVDFYTKNCLPLTSLTLQRSARLALLIGHTYENSGYELPCCLNDVIIMKKTLEELNHPFEVYEAIIKDRVSLDRSLNLFCEDVGKQSVPVDLLFYFTGHGMSLNGVQYLLLDLLPSSIENSPEDIVISLDEICERFNSIETVQKSLFILDCCRDEDSSDRTADVDSEAAAESASLLESEEMSQNEKGPGGYGNYKFSDTFIKSLWEKATRSQNLGGLYNQTDSEAAKKLKCRVRNTSPTSGNKRAKVKFCELVSRKGPKRTANSPNKDMFFHKKKKITTSRAKKKSKVVANEVSEEEDSHPSISLDRFGYPKYRKNYCILYSVGPGEKAMEGNKLGFSFFTSFLIKIINNNKTIYQVHEEINAIIEEHMRTLQMNYHYGSELKSFLQEPWIW